MRKKLREALDLGFRPFLVKNNLNAASWVILPGYPDFEKLGDGTPKEWWSKNQSRVLADIEDLYNDDPPYLYKDYLVIYGNFIKMANIAGMFKYDKECSFGDTKNRAFLVSSGKRQGARSVIVLSTGAILFTDIHYFFLAAFMD